MELLLSHLGARTLVAGIATDNCVPFTAGDALLRGNHHMVIAEDGCAAIGQRAHHQALEHMTRTLKARRAHCAELTFSHGPRGARLSLREKRGGTVRSQLRQLRRAGCRGFPRARRCRRCYCLRRPAAGATTKLSIDILGWASSVVLLLTIATQIAKQYKARSAQGVSRWLFFGQLAASAGFTVYSFLVHNWVFVVTNGLMALSAIVGAILTARFKTAGSDS